MHSTYTHIHACTCAVDELAQKYILKQAAIQRSYLVTYYLIYIYTFTCSYVYVHVGVNMYSNRRTCCWLTGVRTSCLVLISFLTYANANANAIFPRRCLTAVCQKRSLQTDADVCEFSRYAAVLAQHVRTYVHIYVYIFVYGH